jgi:hypothetical protein
LILGLTLWPSAGQTERELDFWCFLCGSRGVADGLLNLFLFAPLGSGLYLLKGPFLALGGSTLLSSLVELIQTGLPGRFSTMGDLVFNSVGGLAGAFLVAHLNRLRGVFWARSWTVRTGTLLFPAGLFLATAILSTPHFPNSIYYGQWTHHLGSMRPYPGRVLSGSVGVVPIPDGRIPDQRHGRAALAAGEPIQLLLVAGPEPSEPSHLFAIYDDHQREILLVGVQGMDLVFERRTVSSKLRMDQPSIRWPGAMEVALGDTVTLSLWREGRDFCMQVGTRRRCDLSPGVEGGWRILHRLSGAPPLLVGFFSLCWMVSLCLPLGLLCQRKREVVLAGSTLAGIAGGVSWLSPWLSIHAVTIAWPMLGVWAGSKFRQRVTRSGAGTRIASPDTAK